jgi:hypothetical protein
MRRLTATRLLATFAVVVCGATPAHAGLGDSSGDEEVSKTVTGFRTVTLRNSSGQFTTIYQIPSNSAFATYEGRAAKCTFTVRPENTTLSDGQQVEPGTVVTSNYVFDERPPAHPTPPSAEDLGTDAPSSKGPLDEATRTFSVYCDEIEESNFLRVIQVAFKDPVTNPSSGFDELRDDLQIDRPVVFTNPVVGRFGGLVTRYPSWLAIHPSAWRTYVSPGVEIKRAMVHLIAQPRELDFIVDFVPNPEKPSPASRAIVPCIPAVPATDDGNALPALPELPEMAEPGTNGPCMWTPPGPGTVTITARVTYSITFWVNGYTEPDDDYVWESEPTAFTTGELIAVNTDPNG